MTDDGLATPLPLRDSQDIQGNILAGFNKDQQTFLFLRFGDPTQGRAYLKALTPRLATTQQVTTFNEQFSAARRLRGGDDPERLKAVWVNIGLTHHGLITLGPGLRRELRDFSAFTQGPAARAADLADIGLSAPQRWILGVPGQTEVDVILTVAADDDNDLLQEVDRQRTLATAHGLMVIFEQRGETLCGDRAGHEHFGFKDGVSQPGVIGYHESDPDNPSQRKDHPGTEMIEAGEFILGLVNESGSVTPVPPWMMHGSFQVFRRLSQDVPGWWAQIIRAQQLLPANDPLSADALAAKTVGRWRSGTPLAQAPDRDNRSVRERTEDNNFKFDDDPEGLKTPIFAHIRKMYPRNPGLGDRQRRIIRRGIPFGDPFDPTNGRGHGVDADRGLIFNVFMASIEGQFEFLQQTWANNPDFQSQNDGPDPVIGESSKPVTLHREGRPDAILDFRRFVHTSGAVYAFAPSISTLLKLGNGELGQDNDPDAIHVGDTVFIRADQDVNWRIRSTPSLSGRVMTVIGPRTTLTVTDGPAEQDGHTWWKVRTANNREGWITALALVKTL